jgi:hypothetical protein
VPTQREEVARHKCKKRTEYFLHAFPFIRLLCGRVRHSGLRYNICGTDIMNDKHIKHWFLWLFVLPALMLLGCQRSTKQMIVGKWKTIGQPSTGQPNMVVEYLKDGTLIFREKTSPNANIEFSISGRYAFTDDVHVKQTMVFGSGSGAKMSNTYKVEIPGNYLTWKDAKGNVVRKFERSE